jgi:curli production assembly/transport component CsgG
MSVEVNIMRNLFSPRRAVMLLVLGIGLSGCSAVDIHRKELLLAAAQPAELTPVSASHRDLVSLPPPKGKIVASVYGFRDQTGQYKPSPDSSFSTAVTQGATALLIKAMTDSNWFIPVEREGLQNILTERRIVRALEPQQPGTSANLPGLLPSNILLEGGIIAYDTNVRTGGAGARFMGIGSSEEYRTDQVTVNLRAVDVRTGRILISVSTSKSIYSYKLSGDIYRFVSFQRLLEAEVGYTRNEPGQLCAQEAIEAALAHLIVRGVKENHWALLNANDMRSPLMQSYLLARSAEPPPPEGTERRDTWLQLGAFGNRENAEGMRRRLANQVAALGNQFVVRDELDNVHRLQLGPYRDSDEARRVAGQLRNELDVKSLVITR